MGLAAQIETPHMVAAVQLLLLTGARVSEIIGSRWEWVDWDNRIIHLPDSKTGAKPIYLSETAIKVLELLKTPFNTAYYPVLPFSVVAGWLPKNNHLTVSG